MVVTADSRCGPMLLLQTQLMTQCLLVTPQHDLRYTVTDVQGRLGRAGKYAAASCRLLPAAAAACCCVRAGVVGGKELGSALSLLTAQSCTIFDTLLTLCFTAVLVGTVHLPLHSCSCACDASCSAQHVVVHRRVCRTVPCGRL
jgi:hypothetical protein